MAKEKMPLYMATRLDLLAKHSDDIIKNTKQQPKEITRKALPKLFEKAHLASVQGDDERAYVFYLSYITLVTTNKFTETEHEKRDLNKAFEDCERIKSDLKQRYQQLENNNLNVHSPAAQPPNGSAGTFQPSSRVDKHITDITSKPAAPPQPISKQPADNLLPEGNIPDVNELTNHLQLLQVLEKGDDGMITAKELKELLAQGKALVIDCRSAEAFANSQIKGFDAVINIPKSKIYPGVICENVVGLLSKNDQIWFNRRKEFANVVIMDWNGDSYDGIYTAASIIEDALFKWTTESIRPRRLVYGYKLWCSSFPQLTTNPRPDEALNERMEKSNATPQSDLKGNHYDTQVFHENLVVPTNPLVSDKSKTPAEHAPTQGLFPDGVVQGTMIHGPKINNPAMPSPSESKPNSAIPEGTTPRFHGGVSNGTGVPKVEKANSIESALRPVPTSNGLSIVEKNSTTAVQDFVSSTNEKISAKPRTRSETKGAGLSTSIAPSSHKPMILRSRSLSDIYEDSNSIIPQVNGAYVNGIHGPLPQPGQAVRSVAPRPSIDRGLKPRGSIDTPTIHGAKKISEELGKPISNGVISTPTMKRRATNATIPPRSVLPRRSGSPVQACGLATDRTAGLKNMGNTCYMNSVLQALAHSQEFSEYFIRRKHQVAAAENIDNPRGSKGVLPAVFSQLISDMWSQRDTREPLTRFRQLMGELYPMYAGYNQQDAHEFLCGLLEKLHEDVNEGRDRRLKKADGNDDRVITFDMLTKELNTFFCQHLDLSNSIVTQHFEGILVSGLKCGTCGKDSYTFQVFNVLSVPIPNYKVVDILDCFDEFFKEEQVCDWMCPHCKQKRNAIKHLKIARLPKQLIIHLVRFKSEYSTSVTITKRTKIVGFEEILDTRELAQYVFSKDVKLKSYTLYGVVNHIGSLTAGHYFSECRFLPNRPWYRYNDNQVSLAHASAGRPVETADAYMLFYSCADT